jgi:hypothetical protein
LTIADVVLSFATWLGVTNTAQLFHLLIPKYTRSESYLYRVIKDLERAGEVRLVQNGTGKLIKTKNYRRRQVEHDLGVNDVLIGLVLSFWKLGYPFEPYFVPLNGWMPDGVVGFSKGSWRLVAIEYQRSPITKRRWKNKLNGIKLALVEKPYQAYVLVVIKSGVFYSDQYVAELARLTDHPDFYFATKEAIDQTPKGDLLTAPIWHHAEGKVAIFEKR